MDTSSLRSNGERNSPTLSRSAPTTAIDYSLVMRTLSTLSNGRKKRGRRSGGLFGQKISIAWTFLEPITVLATLSQLTALSGMATAASQATRTVWQHPGVRWVAAGWIGFITENLVLSHHRDYLIAHYGDDIYHITYNILSTAACSSIFYGWWKHGKSTFLVFPRRSPLIQLAGFTIQALGLIGLSQLAPAVQIPVGYGVAPAKQSETRDNSQVKTERKLYVRCPLDFRASKRDGEVYGVERVTRHPALWSLGFAGLGTAMTTVYPTTAVLCSFPLIFAYLGGAHQDYRYRRGSGGVLTAKMEAATSHLPFQALIEGRQSWQQLGEEIKPLNAGLAVLSAALLTLRRLRQTLTLNFHNNIMIGSKKLCVEVLNRLCERQRNTVALA